MFFVSDPHFSQGNGEVALTAVEGSLRGTFRLSVLKQGSRRIPGNRGRLDGPFGETPDFWIPIGLDADLDEAMKNAAREGVEFLAGEFGMPRVAALSYMSAASDFVVSQVVDRTKGIHGLISKGDFVRRGTGGNPRQAG